MVDTNLNFAKRNNYIPIEKVFQIESMDSDLRTDLFNLFYSEFLETKSPFGIQHSLTPADNEFHIHKHLWSNYFKKPLTSFQTFDILLNSFYNDFFSTDEWFKIYDFLEYLIEYLTEKYSNKTHILIAKIKNILFDNNAGYTLVNNKFIPIINKEEIESLIETHNLADSYELTGVKEHLTTALKYYSNKPNPDFRNSIKESISMVESICKIIEPNQNTLGKALNKLENKKIINSNLKSGFEKLYAYTNGSLGIRHAIMEEESIEKEDARFFLISCSAFTNYLIEKAVKEKII